MHLLIAQSIKVLSPFLRCEELHQNFSLNYDEISYEQHSCAKLAFYAACWLQVYCLVRLQSYFFSLPSIALLRFLNPKAFKIFITNFVALIDL